MRKIIRKSLILILALAEILLAASECFAGDSVLHGLYVKAEELDSSFAKYISSIYLANTASGWTLYVNGYSQGTKSGNPISFSYSPNANTNYVLTFDVSGRTASGYYQNTVEDTVISIFNFAIEDAEQTVVFQSDPDAEPVTKTAVKNADGYYDFGQFTFTHKEKPVSFTLKINANTNKAVISREGKEYTYTLTGSGKYETVYCEALVPAQELDLNYMETNLEKQTYTSAKTILYSEDDINDALSNYKYTLVNNKTGKTTTVPLKTRITYWSRNEDSGTAIGDGTYTESSKSVQVVCQWDEDRCSSIRSKYGEANRPFAVYGTNTEYNYVAKSTTEVKKTLYQNVSWPSSNWSDAVSFGTAYSALDSDYGVVRYRTAPANWGDYSSWSEYTSAKARACSNSDNCQYETQTKYAYYTRAWGSWSDYVYTACTASADETECKSADRFSKRTRSWGSWSGYTYTGTSSLGCSAVGSALTSNACEREAGTMYRKKTGTYSSWSDYTAWASGTCTSSDTKNCESRTRYAWRSMGSWSEWEPTTLNVSCSTSFASGGGEKGLNLLVKDCKTETQTRYKTRSFDKYTYSDYGGYTSTSKYGSYTAGCLSTSLANSLCGVKSYKTCRAKACGVESTTYKSCQNSACGIASTTYKSCRDSACGIESTTYKSCQNSACGVASTTYKSCRNSACGVESVTYKSCATASCGVSSVTYKSCQNSACGCKTYNANASKCGTNWLGNAKRCAAAGCETYKSCRTVGCGVEKTTYKTCRAKACGVESTTYKSCRTSGCGVESTTYKSCRTAGCGVDYYTYKSCRTAGCGVESTTYKSCRTAGCGVDYYTYKSCEDSSCGVSSYNTCTLYSCPSTRTANYTAWSAWSDWGTGSCTEGTYKLCESKTVNYKRTRSWGSWSDYVYSAAATSATIDVKSQAQSRYQTRTLTYSDWSDYIYSSCTASSTTQCDSATRYRVRYLGDWSSWSSYNLTSCTKSDTTDCRSQTMYSKRTMGSWGTYLSGTTANGLYGLTNCTDTQTKKCVSQTQIRQRYKTAGTYGAWSGRYTDIGDIPYNADYYYQYQYNNGVFAESSEKGTSTEVGTGSMYVKTVDGGKQVVETAVVATKSYTVSDRMTTSEISSFTSTLGTEAAESSYVNSLISGSTDTNYYGSKYISWADWEESSGQNNAAGNAAVSRFLNEKRFIPYIFITQHHRATNAKFLIEGYNDEAISSSMVIRTTNDDTQSFIRLYPDEQPFCEVYPDDSSCIADPVTPPDNPDEPDDPVEPDFCTLYPMSARCNASSLDTAVIYYNYLDPLENYTQYTLPSNWVGLNSLINEIKASDLSSYKIKVTLRNSDISAMRDWLDENPDKVGTGEMIKAFSYIFETDDEQIKALIQNGGVNQ